ncbi:MAG: DUF1800 domain-containing protein [Bacteroidota bacterium]|nr:DUF1800 domain-containing protein [Bacteroidota bacterium]
MKRSEFLTIWQDKRMEGGPAPINSLNPYVGPWTSTQAIHLLKRLTFGVKKADVDTLLSKSMSQAVDSLLVLDNTPAPPLNIYSTPQIPDPDVPFGQTFVNAPINANLPPQYYQARTDSLKAWWTGNMVNQKLNITEKLTLFWHNHFAVEADQVQIAQALHQYYKLLRENCLGNFKALTKLITLNPAMLRYLNGYLNSKEAADENYARELQELFTVGKGPDSKYTEDDVKAAAKILTGITINITVMPLTYFFNFFAHDTTTKRFSSFYGNKVIAGRPFAQGELELDDLLTMLFDNTETARHICRKLYRFFVYYEISEDVEQNIIRPLAVELRNNNFNIKPVLETLFKSQHFYDYANLACVIKSPLDYSVGLCKEFGIQFPNSSNLLNQYLGWGIVTSLAAYQGLNIGDPLVVSGWQAWYQQPQYHEIWINADTLASKNSTADKITSSAGVTLNGVTIKIDPTIFASQLDKPESAADHVKEAVQLLYNFNLSDSSLLYLKDFLISGYPNDSYWTEAWIQYKADPTNPILKNAVAIRLNALYREMIRQAEYHLS